MGAQIRETVDALSRVTGLKARDLETGIKNALRYVSHKATPEDRYDVLHEIALALLSTKLPDGAYASGVARNTVGLWNQRFFYRDHERLDRDSGDADADNAYKDRLIGAVEFEARSCGNMDGQRLWDTLPGERVETKTGYAYTGLKGILQKRLRGARLSGAERIALMRYRQANTGLLTE